MSVRRTAPEGNLEADTAANIEPAHNSVRSMTGYARVRRLIGAEELTLSLKALNHRALDVHFHMPSDFDAYEPTLRAVIKRTLIRGHVQVQVKLSSGSRTALPIVNTGLLEAYLDAFHRVAAVYGLHGEPDLNAAFRLPGMFEGSQPEAGPDLERVLLDALSEALELMNEFRAREGAEIAVELRTRNQTILECAAGMEELRSQALPGFHARLTERLAELLEKAALDPQRLAQEAAYLADRTDISEELTRLKTHAGQVRALLDEGGELGKKLDFLLQEMQRETNTVLSKSAGAGALGLKITDLALVAKAEIEKIREQALNLE